MDMGLKGKVAWLTGATGAIGREITLAFAREGTKIAVSARNKKQLTSLAKEVNDADGNVLVAEMDVTNQQAVKSCSDRIFNHFGSIDILVTTVAVPAFGPFLELDKTTFQAALDVKYLGYINCYQAALPHMLAQKSGTIVGITGTAGKMPIDIHLPGGSVNAALNLVLKGLSNEFGPKGIRINAVSPGPIMSERQKQMIDAGMRNPAKGIPLGRLGEAAEVADSVVFLSSGRASYITGQVLSLDGGGIKAL